MVFLADRFNIILSILWSYLTAAVQSVVWNAITMSELRRHVLQISTFIETRHIRKGLQTQPTCSFPWSVHFGRVTITT